MNIWVPQNGIFLVELGSNIETELKILYDEWTQKRATAHSLAMGLSNANFALHNCTV
jgi:hypothetical protein